MAKPLTNSILIKLIKEEIETVGKIGTTSVSNSAYKRAAKDKYISSGDIDDKEIDGKEKAILMDVDAALSLVAQNGDLTKHKSELERLLKKILATIKKVQEPEQS